MNRKNRISEILKKKLINFDVVLEDDSYKHRHHNNFDGKGETHFSVILKNKNNEKINRLATHRLINHLLKEEFKQGLHALEIRIT